MTVLRSVLRVVEVTAQQPMGLLSLLVFLGGFATFVTFQGRSARASIAAFWVVCIGFVSLAYEVSETTRHLPDISYYTNGGLSAEAAVSSPRSISPPGNSHRGTGGATSSGPPNGGGSWRGAQSNGGTHGSVAGGSTAGGSAAGGGGSTPPASTAAVVPGSEGAAPAASEQVAHEPAPSTQSPDSAPLPQADIRWVPDGVVSGEKVIANQPCPESGTAARDACKSEYTIAITCRSDQRLIEPQLRCVEGDCASAAVQEVRVSSNGQRVDGRFEVWGASTRWELTAEREARVADGQ